MLLKKEKEYMDYYNKYNNRYRILQESPFLVYIEGHGEKEIKYYRYMRDVYRKKLYDISVVINRRRFP